MSNSLFNINTAHAQPREGAQSLNNIIPVNGLNAQNNGAGGNELSGVLNQLFYLGLAAAAVLAVAMIVRGGIQYMASSDSADSKGRAKRRIQAAIGGLVLAFASVLLLSTINPSLTKLNLRFAEIKLQESRGIGLDSEPNNVELVEDRSSVNGGNRTAAAVGPNGELIAQIGNINNPTLNKASADGTIVLNGTTYTFRSGGGGDGYLPPGTYTISDGRLRSDNSSMMVDGYGYSFNLNDAYDERIGRVRDELRIHPDGGSPGTIGCIGIQGSRATQEQFYRDMQAAISQNGGSYRITVGR